MTTPLDKLLHDCIGASGAAALNEDATQMQAIHDRIGDGSCFTQDEYEAVAAYYDDEVPHDVLKGRSATFEDWFYTRWQSPEPMDIEPVERQYHPDDPSNPHVRRWW